MLCMSSQCSLHNTLDSIFETDKYYLSSNKWSYLGRFGSKYPNF